MMLNELSNAHGLRTTEFLKIAAGTKIGLGPLKDNKQHQSMFEENQQGDQLKSR